MADTLFCLSNADKFPCNADAITLVSLGIAAGAVSLMMVFYLTKKVSFLFEFVWFSSSSTCRQCQRVSLCQSLAVSKRRGVRRWRHCLLLNPSQGPTKTNSISFSHELVSFKCLFCCELASSRQKVLSRMSSHLLTPFLLL